MPKTVLENLKEQLADARILVKAGRLPASEITRLQAAIAERETKPTRASIRAKQAAWLAQYERSYGPDQVGRFFPDGSRRP